ncbi:valine--tRNA ligase [Syntrophomonas wolfei]|jgi:valyl-tRNA synthetase|uniref:Valine--tRNA ligase n=1 Tax=Syntrophomonas wolfei subsp. wolfei (strain DSM 2245B / Goettingen) TaxID=335541 RepID=Q0AWF6_SYNWW|nr:valine--tRNA ligase [Syntrophomonas wolfei]ABI68948.1 valyl-tRNA synthetase [Syntrophomonas wolfei subsp. wolfei str. Goettingen G311]
MSMATSLPSVYEPGQVENKWYEYWRENNYFAPRPDLEGKAFSIVMPPPNVTGSLHLGHALDNTLQDILTRWRRMQGYNALWLPGTDHAGIATQARVEEALAREGLNKYELGREKFLERVWEWKHLYGNRITQQLSLMGSSCDWSRERFTMDEGCSRAVREVFVNLYEKGLIYQGDYIINWCPRCHTAISDIEVEHEDSDGHLWHIRYPLEGEDEFIVVATTRPETMLGDTGVAVHPDDERYQHLIGKKILLPLMNRVIPVFADDYVDKEFGTGAVKVTPAHDPNDFDMGLRHGVEQIAVIDKYGFMNENAGPYQGLDRYACRLQVVKDLEAQGYLLKVEEHRHAVGHCQRCDTVIEPLVSTQWFVKMKPLAEPAIQKVLDGEIKFIPERFTRIYINWMENIRDWCISRQLWWGHRIPVWYCQECGEIICSKEDPNHCPNCESAELKQDEDVLDTWFSSALWPFSTLGWPDKTRDLDFFYPTTVLVTGRDIIFFWVARMIFSGIEHMGEVPFYDVNIHGLILDAQGRKMSKSLNNGIDPIEVIEKFGADTLRFSLITGVTPGNDVRFHWDKVENTRNFANKIWNASRFVLMNMEGFEAIKPGLEELSLADRWILSRLQLTIAEVTNLLDKYDLGEAARRLYEFIWDEFCDWYIELAKPRLVNQDNPRERLVVQNVLRDVLVDILRLLHPFMPFITEEIYQFLPAHSATIMLDPWPESKEELIWLAEVEQMQQLMQAIRALRNIRSEFNINPSILIKAIMVVPDEVRRQVFMDNQAIIKQMARLEQLELLYELEKKPEQAVSALLSLAEIYVPLEGIIDVEKEIQRLQKELKAAESDLQKAENKLNNQKFLSKAPPEVIEKERSKAGEAINRKEGILQRLHLLKK